MSNNIIITENRNISAFFNIDYENYKYNMIKEIFKQLDFFIDLFNEEFNDNLIKIYILYKKKVLKDHEINLIKKIYNLCIYLNRLVHIDQEEYLNIIFDIINLFILIKKYKKHNSNYSNNYNGLINMDMLINNLTTSIMKMADNNIIIKTMLQIINSSNKKYILEFAETLSNDYFMYSDAEDMYKIIIKNFSTTKNNIAYNIKKYKIEFVKTYFYKQKKLKDIYIDQANTKLVKKFKYVISNPLLNELCKDFSSIKKNLSSS